MSHMGKGGPWVICSQNIKKMSSLNPITNKYFDGVYSSDTLKEIKEKPNLIICNTDPSNKPGEHWVLFFFSEN